MSSELRRAPSNAAWLSRLGIDLRSGEGALFALLLALHFLLLAFQYAAKAVRQSAFIDELGAERLPLVYLAVAIVVYPLLKLWERWTRGHRLDRLLVGAAGLAGLCLFAFAGWFALYPGSPWPSIVFYIWTAIVGILLVSLFWSYVASCLDPRQARRLIGAIGAAGILGSVAGGQIARWGTAWGRQGSVSGALISGALLLFGVAGLLALVSRRQAASVVDEAEADLGTALDGLSIVRRSPYLRWIALGVLLSAFVAQVIDLQFGWAVERATDTLEQRAAAFGNLYSVMGLAAFVFQLTVTSRLHRRLGVGLSLSVLPTACGIGSVGFLVAAVMAPAWILPVAWALKLTENGLRYSVDQATRELLFQPIAKAERPRVKLCIDVLVQRSAKGLAAMLLLSVTFGWISVVHTVWISLVAIGLWLVALGSLHRHYVIAFRDGLLHRVAADDSAVADALIDLHDAATLEVLVAGLGSADPREVRHSLELLDRHGRGHLVAPWILAHGDAGVRRTALGVLRRAGRQDAVPWIDRLLGDPDPAVRAAAIRTLAAVAPEDLRRPMETRLYDSDPRVRSVAVAYLAIRSDPEARGLADSSLAEMLVDTDPEVRRSAAQALAEMPEPHHQASLVHLLYDPHVEVTSAALDAVQRRSSTEAGASALYLPIVVSHLQRRRLKHDARSTLVAYGERAIPALEHFLLDRNEAIWVRRALPKTVARIGGSRALRTLVQALGERDGFLRRKVVEALVTLRQNGGPCADRQLLEAQIGVECRGLLRLRLDLWSLEALAPNAQPTLLQRLLEDRLNAHADRVFGLLELIHDPREIRATRRGLEAEQTELRAHALEFLDNVLQGEVRSQVFSAFDDLPRAERARQAQRLYGLVAEPAVMVLERLATDRPAGDFDAPWTTAAALWFIAEAALESLYPTLRQVAERDDDPLVQETTGVLLARLGQPGESSGASGNGRPQAL